MTLTPNGTASTAGPTTTPTPRMTMRAITQDRYGGTETLTLRDGVAVPAPGSRRGARPGARGRRRPGRVAPDGRAAAGGPGRVRPAQAQAPGPRLGPGRHRRGRRTGRRRLHGRRPGAGRGHGRLRGAGRGQGRQARPRARRSRPDCSRRPADLGSDRPAGGARPRPGGPRPARARDRRLGRCRVLRGTDRLGDRRGCHRRGERRQGRPGALVRRVRAWSTTGLTAADPADHRRELRPRRRHRRRPPASRPCVDS